MYSILSWDPVNETLINKMSLKSPSWRWVPSFKCSFYLRWMTRIQTNTDKFKSFWFLIWFIPTQDKKLGHEWCSWTSIFRCMCVWYYEMVKGSAVPFVNLFARITNRKDAYFHSIEKHWWHLYTYCHHCVWKCLHFQSKAKCQWAAAKENRLLLPFIKLGVFCASKAVAFGEGRVYTKYEIYQRSNTTDIQRDSALWDPILGTWLQYFHALAQLLTKQPKGVSNWSFGWVIQGGNEVVQKAWKAYFFMHPKQLEFWTRFRVNI